MTSWVEVRDGLKPFQVATVDAAVHGLWHDGTTSRFLVADEVGLGKTLVAKGVIARLIEHLQQLGDERIDIVYICSNRAISRQNLLKLKEFAEGHEESADRLTKLIAAEGLRAKGVNVVALTPGTSFTFGHRSGQFDERALLYAVLNKVWPGGRELLKTHGAKRFFYYGISKDDRLMGRARLTDSASQFEKRISAGGGRIVHSLIRERNDELRASGQRNIYDELRHLSPLFGLRNGPTNAELEQRQALMGELRQILAEAGIQLLRPDLVIMDEFQRFADLLDPRSVGKPAELLRSFITADHEHNHAATKVLLLSATPYRWFDRSGEGSHHSDFLSTLRFLHDGDEAAVQRVEQALGDLRKAVRIDSIEDAQAAVDDASTELRKVMSRTERLSSTPDRNGMLRDTPMTTPITEVDVRGYVAAQHLGDELQSPAVVELWKTAPWIANLGDGYKLTNNLLERSAEKTFDWSDPSLLDIDAVSRFDELTVPNPRLRWMIDRTVGQGWHRLVWMPPSRRYYATDNEFDTAARSGITKQLVFSSWRIAPKAIALGVTYAAEQAMEHPPPTETLGTDEWANTTYRAHDRALLDLRLTGDGTADSVTSFLLVAPFSGLANLVDPLTLGLDPEGSLRSLDDVRDRAKLLTTDRLGSVLSQRGSAESEVDWYLWAARHLSAEDDQWWSKAGVTTFAGDDTKERRGLRAHIAAFRSPGRPEGRPPDNLVDVLVDLALASPAVCAQRSLRRVLDTESLSEPALLDAAAQIGWGFRSLFDTPEVINVVDAVETNGRPYWQTVLRYSADGHLQSVLDEYMHMLREWKVGGRRGLDDAQELAVAAVEALSFRTVTLDTRVPANNGGGVQVRKLRSRFAVRFGDKSSDQDDDRKDVTSAAFNSPFWPFVMATTSIGQEGLDFHLYSHALIHWNLPHDPVSLEQREGRVHRFKGHAVRKNVASAARRLVVGPSEDVWDAMFDHVTPVKGSDGITPFWIFEGDAKVQRIVPMLPMSREESEIDRLKQAAATYRMAFGQPRHGDLLEIVGGRTDFPTIDLSPR